MGDNLSKGDIMIVDDTPANLQLLTSALSQEGYRVRPLMNGEMALQAAQLAAPDLILLDINMPELNGYEVCRRLKQNEELRKIPVIFISAHSTPLSYNQLVEAGAVDYIGKPVRLDEVLEKVKYYLR